MNTDNDRWHCPIQLKEISEGACIDINYVRLGFMKSVLVTDLAKEFNITTSDIDALCDNCQNSPFRSTEPSCK